MKVAMTGTSGNMGREALEQVLTLKEVEFVRVLLSNRKRNDKLSKRYKKRYRDRIEILRGSIEEKALCKKLVEGVDYVVHMAAVIPPRSDSDEGASYRCNYLGTAALADAVAAEDPQPSFVHISTMALYGNRNELHPWGRMGDPLLVSAFDPYAMHKLMGERYVLEKELKRFVVLRQTAMLHPNMLNDNVSDGLMFHTVLNAPLEWVSARDSGYLIKRVLERDGKGEIEGFWNNLYNITAGKRGRDTGYDTFLDGFALIGGSPEKFFRPNWFATRNFHGVWFADDELERYFHYQRDGVEDYWKEIGKRHKLFALAKLVPAKLIDRFLFQKLLFHPNSPYRWLKDRDEARVLAYFGGEKEALSLPSAWKDVKLIAKGDFGDYDALREGKEKKLLSHGYDEGKPLSALSLEELQAAAAFRGGKCLSAKGFVPEGEKLRWQCSEGHEFESSLKTVLRGGHWCPVCCTPTPWQFDLLAKKSPFFAQVYYDSHRTEENHLYDLKDGKSSVREAEL